MNGLKLAASALTLATLAGLALPPPATAEEVTLSSSGRAPTAPVRSAPATSSPPPSR